LAFSADTGTSSTDFITSTAAQTITATLSGAPAGTDIVYGSLDNGTTWTDITNKVTGTTLTWNGVTLTASSSITFKITDAAGNDSSATGSTAYVLDTVAPTLAITSNVSAVKIGETATVTFTFSEDPGATFSWDGSSGDVVVTGGTLGAISGTGLTRTATFTPTAGLASGNASITVASGAYTDTAGNTGGAGTTPSISIDTLAPTLAITSNVSAVKIGETATITFTLSEATANFAAGDVVTTGGTLSGFTAVSGTVYTATFTPTASLASGNASITVAGANYTDAAGNTGGAGTTPSISIDTVAPTLAITSNVSAVKIGETATITFTLSEATANFAAGDVVTTGGTLSGFTAVSGTVYTATFTPTASLASGNASITVAGANYTDAAGNTGGNGTTPSISIDTLAPTLAITSNVSAVKIGETATITFTLSEATANFAAGDVVTTGGALSGFTAVSGTVYTATFTPTASLASGNASITVAGANYTDAAGNTGGNGTTPSISIDTVAPTLAITSNVSAVKAGETATLTFTFSEDPGATFSWDGSSGDVVVTGGSLGAISGTGLTRTATFTPTAGLASGNAGITVAGATYTDAAGNAGGAGATPSISIDTLAPTAPSTPVLSAASDSGILNSDKITNVTTPVITGTAEAGSTVTLYDTDGTTVLGTAVATGGNWSITSSVLAAGTHTLTAKATDVAGNTGTASTGLDMTIDTVVPTISGAVAAQAVNDNATKAPFAALVIADTGVPTQTQTVTITLDTAAKGALSNLGGGSYNAVTGVYSFTGTAAAATTAVNALVFTPTANRVTPSLTETTTFTVVSTDAAGNTVNNAVSTMVSTSINDAPTIAGASAGQAVNDNATQSPFTAVTIDDVDSPAQTQTVTVTLDDAAKGALSNLGGGSYNAATGVYSFTGTAAQATTAIRALVFTPTVNRVSSNLTETTTFAISVNDGVVATNNAVTTVVSTSVNDSPTGVGTLSLIAVNEDTANPTGVAISALTGYNFQDVDAAATSPGIVVVGNTANAALEGAWQYSSDGGVNWKAVGAVSDNATALALASSTRLRFVPAANFNGTPAGLTIRVLDNTYEAGFSSTTGGTETRVTANSAINGGITAVSTNLNTINTSITAVNDVPAFTKGANQTVNEDAGAQTVSGWATGLSNGPANENGQTLSFDISNNNNALFSVQPTLDSNGNLSYTPAANANGSATVTVSLKDSGGTANGGIDTSDSQTFVITVNSVNDAPDFTKGANQSVNEDAGAQTVSGWATGLSQGPADESGQTLNFTTSNDNNALFSVQPTIDSNGNLSYTPTANASGSATVTVSLKDNGGTANGGVDTRTSQTFIISVSAVNQAPGFTKGADQTINEDAGTQTVSGWATGLSTGPANESGQTLSFTASNDNNALFSVQPIIDSNGNLSYTPAANANGSATVTVSLKDSGGTANGGIDASAGQTFVITVNSVNDAPAFTKGANQTVNEDAGAQTVSGWATGLSNGPANENGQALSFDISNNNNALFSVQPTIDSNGNLSYTPAANANGSATVTVSIKDSGGTANGGVDTSVAQTFTITVNPVNALPTGAVTISGTPSVGTALTAANSLADSDGLGVVSYQWQADGIDIAGATGDSYVPTEAQAGKAITVVARYTDAQGTVESVVSAAVDIVNSTAINLNQQTGNSDSRPVSDSGSGSVNNNANTNTGNNSGSNAGTGNNTGSNTDTGTGTGNNTGNADRNNNASDTQSSDTGNSNTSGNNNSGNNSNSNSGSNANQTIVVDMKLSIDARGNGTTGGTVNLPSSAFAGLNTSGTITITAAQSSGQSLPSFISVNPSTGAVTVKEGAVVTSPITVKVTIKDSQGKQVVVLIKVQPQKNKAPQQNRQQDQQPDDGQENNPQGQEGRGQNQQGQLKQTDKQLAHAGRPGLTQQLQRVGSKGFELQRQKLLDSLASLVGEDKDAA